MSEENITVEEKHLSVNGRPEELKLMAEALYEYAEKRGMDLPKTVGDLCYNVNATYQTLNELDEDNWDFTDEDKYNLGLDD